MKIFIIGGEKNKPSKLVEDIYIDGQVWKYNGFNNYRDFLEVVQEAVDNIQPDLIIWLVEIPKNEESLCIKKPKGSVLIGAGTDIFIRHYDSKILTLANLYQARGNAAIMIYKKNKTIFDFELIDSLGNTWVRTDNFKKVIKHILKLYQFTQKTKRRSLKKGFRLTLPKAPNSLTSLIHINTQLIDQLGAQFEAEYFNLIPTKCIKLFPSMRFNKSYFFSARDIDKEYISTQDMIYIENSLYYDKRKYARDTPFHLEIYKECPHINFLIHGHAYIKRAISTIKYYPCADLNGVKDVKFLMNGKGYMNLYKHGFLIYSRTIEELKEIVEKVELVPKPFEKKD